MHSYIYVINWGHHIGYHTGGDWIFACKQQWASGNWQSIFERPFGKSEFHHCCPRGDSSKYNRDFQKRHFTAYKRMLCLYLERRNTIRCKNCGFHDTSCNYRSVFYYPNILLLKYLKIKKVITANTFCSGGIICLKRIHYVQGVLCAWSVYILFRGYYVLEALNFHTLIWQWIC